MKASLYPSFDALEGALASALVGLAGAILLTNEAITAEVGQILWVIVIVAAVAAIAPSPLYRPAQLIACCLPFYVALFAVFAVGGEATLAWVIAKLIASGRLAIPLAAYTQRDMAIRYGIYDLFILSASMPALVASVLGWHATTSIARRLFGMASQSSPRSTWLKRLWRAGVCSGIIALALCV